MYGNIFRFRKIYLPPGILEPQIESLGKKTIPARDKVKKFVNILATKKH